MKVSLNWLKDYVPIDCSVAELGERLTQIGLNLEEATTHGADTVLDLEVTSNRPDCLGHIGVAREMAAAFGTALRIPTPKPVESDASVAGLARVDVVCPDVCPRYTARVIQAARIGPSPEWLVRRLEALGLRSINNVVDVTNYVLLETGQPLHAFDYDKLADHRIVVRPADRGETFIAIDHSQHELNPGNLVIADARRAVALAGVMGGLDTEVSDGTANILLESAEFDPLSIRRTAREVNLHSESSYRFERGIDPVAVDFASQRAAGLICELAGGHVAKGVVDVWSTPFEPSRITICLAEIKRILGVDVPIEIVEEILSRLGFEPVRQDAAVAVTVPSHRRDVLRPIDLIEEIGRIWGYDKIPIRETIRIAAQGQASLEIVSTRVSDALNQCGFSEAMTVSLVDSETADVFSDVDPATMLRVCDQVRRVDNVLRCSLLPSLLSAARLNQNAGNVRCDLYEVARVYRPSDRGSLPEERTRLATISTRSFRVLRGAVEHAVCALGVCGQLRFERHDYPAEWFLPDQSARVMLGETVLGLAGTICPAVQQRFALRAPLAVAELDFDLLVRLPLEPVACRALPKFPAIERDLSIIVDEGIAWQAIEAAIRDLSIGELEAVEFGELFRGKQIPAGKKSIFLTTRFRHGETSLTHEQVDAYQEAIVRAVQQRCGAVLRTADGS